MTRTVGILVFEDVEVLDVTGPFELFATAEGDKGALLCRVLLVGASREPLRGIGGMWMRPDVTLDECPPLDVLVVPGGDGRKRAMRDERITGWVRERAEGTGVVLSVCTGAFIVAAAGLLEGRAATTHHSALEELRAFAPGTQVVGGRYIDNGHVVTAAGVTSGMDASLHVLDRLFGLAVALRAALRAEYVWRTPDR